MNYEQTNFISNELSLRGGLFRPTKQSPHFRNNVLEVGRLPALPSGRLRRSDKKSELLAMTINGIMNMNLLSFTSKDDYIQKDLRRRFDDARDITEVIDIIELTRYFQFNTLAQQMIADLHEEEKRMWRRHCRAQEEREEEY